MMSFGVVVLNTIGQLLLKKAAQTRGIDNKYLWIGYIYFLATIFVSYFLMKKIELKYFATLMSVNYIVAMLASALFLQENLSRQKVFGTLIVACGVIVFLL